MMIPPGEEPYEAWKQAPGERPSGLKKALYFISDYVMLWGFFYIVAFIIICLLWAVLEVF